MTAPQGLFYWPGVDSILSGSYTLTHGTSPGICTLIIPPQQVNKIKQHGTLLVEYGGTRIQFPNSTVGDLSFEFGEDGREVWRLTILDERWRWQFGQVSGNYNVKMNSWQIRKSTLRTAQELAAILLKAMGVARYNVSQLPNETYPEVNWEYSRPALELTSLCDSLGCRVTYGPNSSVKIVRLGNGLKLPTNEALHASTGFDPAEMPSELVFVGARTLYEQDFELEAVGEQPDGTVVPIDNLDYRPKKGWTFSDIMGGAFDIANVNHRELARRSVFSWYRIKTPFKIEATGESISELDRILPITDHLIEKWKEGPEFVRVGAQVYGLWYDGEPGATVDQMMGKQFQQFHGKDSRQLYHRGFSIDTNFGIVKLATPVVFSAFDAKQDGFSQQPAKLRLRVAFSVREKDTNAWRHEEVKRKVPGVTVKTNPHIVLADDIGLELWKDWQKDEKLDNRKEFEAGAKYYLDAAQLEFAARVPGSIVYPGFRAIMPDGVIQQVTWSTNEGGAITSASVNTEPLTGLPTYEERKFNQKISNALWAERKAQAMFRKQQRGLA